MKTHTQAIFLLSIVGCGSDPYSSCFGRECDYRGMDRSYVCDVDESSSISWALSPDELKCIFIWSPEQLPAHVRKYDGFVWSEQLSKIAADSIEYINDVVGIQMFTLDSVEAGTGVVTIRELPEMVGSGASGNTSWSHRYQKNPGAFLFQNEVKIGIVPLGFNTYYDRVLVLHELSHAISIGHPGPCDVDDEDDIDCECQAMNACAPELRQVDIDVLLNVYLHPAYRHLQP